MAPRTIAGGDAEAKASPRGCRLRAGVRRRKWTSTATLAQRRSSAYYGAILRSGGFWPLATVFVLNGPNLNLLGVREPSVYGRDTLADIEARCQVRAKALDLDIDFRQTNHEGQLVDWIQEARQAADAIVLNAGALTHTSVAVLDALSAAALPIIEVHLSNIFRREHFRHHSYVSLAASGVICGLGAQGYELALEAVAALIEGEPSEAAR
jgi:3-dehydroquinate dehydratase II